MNQSFHRATLTLTGWYLLIIMVISLTFSGILYQISTNELRRGLPPNETGLRRIIVDEDQFEVYRQARADEAISRIVANLFMLNLVTLGLGGGAAYLLARRTLQPIEESVAQQTRFVSDASHELKTPLASMRAEIEVGLRDKKLSTVTSRQLLESSLEEVGRLQALSERLLRLSQDEPLDIGTVELESVAEEIASRYANALAAAKISFVSKLGDYSVKADSAMLTDLVGILVENAIKYSPRGTTIELDAQRRGRMIELSVSDQGQGIAPEDVPRIFDRFYRADAARTTQGVDGHGLGLSIAEQIAQKHGTKITVSSIPKQGSRFAVLLPNARNI